MQLDIHTHTIASGHGTCCTITDMAKAAYDRKLDMIGISDHGPATMAAGTDSYFRSLFMAPRYRCGVRILYGVELNILDNQGTVDLDDKILSHLDYAIASMHSQNHAPGTKEENTESYIQAMKHPRVKLLGHCDDVKYPVDYQALVQVAKEYHVLLELNEASLSPNGYRGNVKPNDLEMLKWCRFYNHPIVLSSDSHGPEQVGLFPYGQALLQETDFPEQLVLNHQLSSFLAFLALD